MTIPPILCFIISSPAAPQTPIACSRELDHRQQLLASENSGVPAVMWVINTRFNRVSLPVFGFLLRSKRRRLTGTAPPRSPEVIDAVDDEGRRVKKTLPAWPEVTAPHKSCPWERLPRHHGDK